MNLEKRWMELWQSLGITKNMFPDFAVVLKRYDEEARYYHNRDHLIHCLGEFDNIKHHLDNPLAVEVAIWYHDVVLGQYPNNEEESAKLAQAVMKTAGINKNFRRQVCRLILLTKHKKKPKSQDKDGKYLIDIDLAILGQEPAWFERYNQAIENEHGWISKHEYQSRRKKFLQGLLKRFSIYSTRLFQNKLETQARRNIKWALRELEQEEEMIA